MLAELKDKKLKSATIIETVVALLILMISFSAGMVIYNRIIDTGISDLHLRAMGEIGFIADSLADARIFEAQQHIMVGERRYEVICIPDERYPGLIRMKIRGIDGNGKILAEIIKLIEKDEHE